VTKKWTFVQINDQLYDDVVVFGIVPNQTSKMNPPLQQLPEEWISYDANPKLQLDNVALRSEEKSSTK
jgi:hypothetical protein